MTKVGSCSTWGGGYHKLDAGCYNKTAGYHKVVKKFSWVRILTQGCHKVDTRYHIHIIGCHKVVKMVSLWNSFSLWNSLDEGCHKVDTRCPNQAT